jgi:hypothetical protein
VGGLVGLDAHVFKKKEEAGDKDHEGSDEKQGITKTVLILQRRGFQHASPGIAGIE